MNENKDFDERLQGIARVVGCDINELHAIYQRIQQKGCLHVEELRRLSSFGVPIVDGISKLKNTPKGEVHKLVASGEITIFDVEQIIKEWTNKKGEFYFMQKY